MRQEVDEVNDAIFAELTYHAAYEPQRAIRTKRWKYIRRFGDRELPVLANIDDGPTKDLLLAAGWGDRPLPREELHDLLFDPAESHNLADEPSHARRRSPSCSGRLEAWMRETEDPLLDGRHRPAAGRGGERSRRAVGVGSARRAPVASGGCRCTRRSRRSWTR